MTRARALADYLARGGRLDVMPAPLRLDPGEVQHVSLPVSLWHYAAGDPTYNRPGIYGGPGQQAVFGALHDYGARRAAREAAPAWRVAERGMLHVTSHRGLLQNPVGNLSSWWHGSARAVQLYGNGVFEAWDQVSVIFDAGQASPYLCVLLYHLAFGAPPRL